MAKFKHKPDNVRAYLATVGLASKLIYKGNDEGAERNTRAISGTPNHIDHK